MREFSTRSLMKVRSERSSLGAVMTQATSKGQFSSMMAPAFSYGMYKRKMS